MITTRPRRVHYVEGALVDVLVDVLVLFDAGEGLVVPSRLRFLVSESLGAFESTIHESCCSVKWSSR